MSQKKGFTLIELLVVISIISLLSSIIMASVNNARERGQMAANIQFDDNILHGIGDQLVGEWKFNDDPGTSNKALDTSSFGNNGNVNGAVWSPTAGFDGKGAYHFSGGGGSGSSITATLKGVTTNNFTISAWVKPDISFNGLVGIIATRNGQMTGLMNYNGEVHVAWNEAYWGTPTGLKMNTGKWNFIAMSVSPTKIVLYVNGQKKVISGNMPALNFSNSPIYIGRDRDQGGLPAYIDNVRIYTAPITTNNQ